MAAPSTKSRTDAANDKAAEAKDEQKNDAEAEAAKESERERKAKEKAEAEKKARDAKIEAGDLIVTDGFEFEKGSKETKVSNQVADIVSAYQDSDQPLVFATVVEKIGAKYPEDLIPAMHALETLGLVERFDAKSTADGAGNRRSTAYRWTGRKVG